MLAYVPVRFDLYRAVRPALRWTLQCLVGFADRTGQCWPSVRKLAEHAGISKSTAARHLSELSRIGIVSRGHRPGRGYEYRIDVRFLPRAPLSHPRTATVPPAPRQETEAAKQKKRGRERARFANPGVGFSELPSAPPWEQRLRSFAQRGFWLSAWGAKPTEPGCLAPAALLHTILAADG